MDFLTLMDEFSKLRKRNADLEAQVASLEDELALARQRLFAATSERRPVKEVAPEALDMFAGAAEALPAAEAADAAESTAKAPRKKRPPEQGRTVLPPHLERVERVVELPEADRLCACGTEMKEVGRDVSEKLEYTPPKFVVVRTVRIRYACPADSLHGVFRARAPAQLIPKGIAGASLVAHVITSKYIDHLPLDRQERILARLGVGVSKTTMADWVGAAFSKLNPLLECLRARMVASDVVNCDETRFSVQRNSNSAPLSRGYIWCYIGDKRWAWFDWQSGRSRSGPDAALEGFEGSYLQSDGYAVYEAMARGGGYAPMGCMAHARRKFVEAHKAGKKGAERAIALFGRLYAVESKARESGLDDAGTLALRQSESVPILAELRAEIESVAAKSLPKSALGGAASYCLNRWADLARYCERGDLQIDNNMVERAIRHLTIGRKNYLFFGSDAGARRAAAIYSLAETCRLHGVDPAEYLAAVLDQVADYEEHGDAMDDLLPDAYACRKAKPQDKSAQ